MFEFNSKKELNYYSRADLERKAGIKPSGNASYCVPIALGVPNKVSQARRINEGYKEGSGWTPGGGYIAKTDGVEVLSEHPFVECGLAAAHVTAFAENGAGGFVSHSSPIRSMDRVLDGLYLNKDAKEITLPKSVTYIGSYAFEDFKKLEKIIIPGDITEIDACAFSGCEKLREINIPANLINMGWHLEDCPNLTSIKIGGSVGVMYTYAINYCDNLKSIYIGGSVCMMQADAINYCDNLTSIEIGGSVGIMQKDAINHCDNLTSIKIGGSVGVMEEDAIRNCDNLTGIKMGDNVKEEPILDCHTISDIAILRNTKINIKMLQKFPNLRRIILANDFVKIPKSLITDLEGIEEIIVPDRVIKIDEGAFANLKNLKKVFITNPETSIHSRAFINCPNLEIILDKK